LRFANKSGNKEAYTVRKRTILVLCRQIVAQTTLGPPGNGDGDVFGYRLVPLDITPARLIPLDTPLENSKYNRDQH
jgi:hypothetical protein